MVHSLKKPGQCGYSHATLNYFLSLLGNPSALLCIPHGELCCWVKEGWGGVRFVQTLLGFQLPSKMPSKIFSKAAEDPAGPAEKALAVLSGASIPGIKLCGRHAVCPF